MPQIKIDEITYHLSRELTVALSKTVKNQLPGSTFDEEQLFKEFEKQLYAACRTWESVPDRAVKP